MKRELRFRAWYKGEAFPLDEDDLRDYEKPQMIYDVQKLYDGMGVNSQVLLGYGSFGGLLEDEEFVIMQYTGLKDKTGKEIYEGDILKPIRSSKLNGVHTVVWYNNGFQIEYKFMREYEGTKYEVKNYSPIYPDSYKVIGNIYGGNTP